MNTGKHKPVLRLFAATVITLFASTHVSHAGEVENAIAAGTLDAIDAVAYMVYGLENRGEIRYDNQERATIKRVGELLLSDEPYGFEIEFGINSSSSIISVRQIDGCNYALQILSYNSSRKMHPERKPEKLLVDLDFSKVVRTSIVRGNKLPLKSEIVGLECKPTENGQSICDGLAKSTLPTAANGETLLKTFAYFREKFCPRQS